MLFESFCINVKQSAIQSWSQINFKYAIAKYIYKTIYILTFVFNTSGDAI